MGNFAVFLLYIFNGFAFACLFWFSDFSRFGAKKSVKKNGKVKFPSFLGQWTFRRRVMSSES